MKISCYFQVASAALLLDAASLTSYAQSPDALRMQAFAQGRANNCISVALIKAAIQHHGIGQVFDTLRTGDQVRVTLHDGTALVLTDAERQQAATWAMFNQPTGIALPVTERAAIVSYANFCYAVMAKYMQTQQWYGCIDDAGKVVVYAPLTKYRRALRKLTDKSICSDNAYRHLGLQVKDSTAPRYNPALLYAAAVAYSDNHAVFVLGKQYDDHGSWEPLATSAKADDMEFEPKWVFELK
ncbi:hypothetical protein [Hymenobacter cheonanensis]|uniref:hypothetical protein n=1 Tax=Hymenobacter sp. CA2-7 TaxID=3063993 RepID=UPI0027144043|nr:hypothetical protein [Hymenobacter sp. CA2-7]MDO7886647.1 hypothetical protein [Hymenobacter sp. CA2-7]